MGSRSDWDTVRAAAVQLKKLEIPFEARIISAHRTPEQASEFALGARENEFGVIIAAAGMAAHLAGAMAANTTLPIIALPLRGGALDGLDALLSCVQMPPGMPVATVAIAGAKNAAVLAAQMLAIDDKEVAERLALERADTASAIAQADAELQHEIEAL